MRAETPFGQREFFLKSSRPSFLIKRAALGNLKASFHCTHWHRFFPLKKAPPLISVFFNGLYTPFGSPVSGGQKPQARRGNRTLLACSVPLRSKVDGASEPSPDFCGMGPPGCLLAWCLLKDFCGNVWWFRRICVILRHY